MLGHREVDALFTRKPVRYGEVVETVGEEGCLVSPLRNGYVAVYGVLGGGDLKWGPG